MIGSVHYYECHITIEPVFDARLEAFRSWAESYGFKVAKLLLQKRAHEAPETSRKDSFCTGHSDDYALIRQRMSELVRVLEANGFAVLRYKIEAVVLDSRCGDSL